ncbi:hypothetical protein GUJ93_ZPchr0012g19444 [Zizania palustris]|uniref:Uncharacterized protein n=1 Tax=Zizania palustris TaxID=103762 RepID=A0A8J5WQH6_ZIZPA|nr:hypothetical protein GUJ93_ZPchr0012g19444 [Zizania palustris]
MKGLLPKTTTMKAAGDKGKDCNKAPVSCSSCVELQVDSGLEVSASTKVSMSAVSDGGAQRRQSQDRSVDKVVVNLDAISPVVGSRREVQTSTGACISPIDVEALDDEVQVVSASQVPQRRNQRTRRRLVAVVDLEVDASWEGNKRQMVIPVIHILSPERKEGSILQWFSLCSQYWLFWPPYRVGVLLAFKWNELFVLS